MALSLISKLLIMVGAVLVVVGVVLHAGSRIGAGQLPGDITWRGRDVTVHVPVATSVALSVALTLVLSLLAWLFTRDLR
jgi:cation transporter-like permease